MSATEHSASLDGLDLYEDLRSVLDQRTLEIIEHRRRTPSIRHRGWLIRRALLAADIGGLSIALIVPSTIFGVGGSSNNGFGRIGEYALFALALPLWVVAAKLYGLYDKDEERTDHSTTDDFAGVFHLVTVTSWLLYAATRVLPVASPAFGKVVVFWAVAVSSISLGRVAARAFCRRSIAYLQNAVIVGAGEVGQRIARKLLQHPEYGINLVGFIDNEPTKRDPALNHLALLGDATELPDIVRLFDVERVIFAFSNDSHQEALELIRGLKDLPVQVDIVPRFFELVSPGMSIHTVEGLPLMGLPPLRLSRSSLMLKRSLDLALAFAALLVLSPLFVIIAGLIKLDSPGPIFFRQFRMGAGERTFSIFKFRSMTNDADARKADVAHMNKHLEEGGDPRMFKIADDPRITRAGRQLRRLSLDELPQLFNVIRGDMSLVGPRPLILEEDQFVEDWARRRLSLRPGMTGLWQVLGRSEIPFGEMIGLDYNYVSSWSLMKDIRLILRTLPLLARPSRGAG